MILERCPYDDRGCSHNSVRYSGSSTQQFIVALKETIYEESTRMKNWEETHHNWLERERRIEYLHTHVCEKHIYFIFIL